MYLFFRQSKLYEHNARTGITRPVLQHATAGLDDLAYDRVTQVLYWTDSRMHAIYATEKTYKYITRVKSTDLLKPRAISIHTTARYHDAVPLELRLKFPWIRSQEDDLFSLLSNGANASLVANRQVRSRWKKGKVDCCFS